LPEVAPYSAFAQEQADFMAGDIAEDRSFFQGLYAHLGETTQLHGHPGFDRTRPFPSARYMVQRGPELKAALNTKARVLGVAPFAILLAAYASVVGEITDRGEVVVAVISNCRVDLKFDRTIGPFTAPYPVPIITGSDIGQMARRCERTLSSIAARLRYPVTDLTEHVPPFIGLPEDTYFTDVGINFTNYRKDTGHHDDMKARVIEILGPIADPELAVIAAPELKRIPGLHLVIDDVDGALRFNFWYHAHRFDEKTVSGWADRYVDRLEQVLS